MQRKKGKNAIKIERNDFTRMQKTKYEDRNKKRKRKNIYDLPTRKTRVRKMDKGEKEQKGKKVTGKYIIKEYKENMKVQKTDEGDT